MKFKDNEYKMWDEGVQNLRQVEFRAQCKTEEVYNSDNMKGKYIHPSYTLVSRHSQQVLSLNDEECGFSY